MGGCTIGAKELVKHLFVFFCLFVSPSLPCFLDAVGAQRPGRRMVMSQPPIRLHWSLPPHVVDDTSRSGSSCAPPDEIGDLLQRCWFCRGKVAFSSPPGLAWVLLRSFHDSVVCFGDEGGGRWELGAAGGNP